MTTRAGKSQRNAAARFRYSVESVSVVVPPGEDVTLQATPDLSIEVPAGAAGDQPAKLTYTPTPQLEGEVTEGFAFESYGDVHLSTGQPEVPLTFTWAFRTALPEGEGAQFYTGSPNDGTLQEIDTEISANRMAATANVSSLSLKGLATFDLSDVSRFTGQLFSTRGDRPTCEGEPPPWVEETNFIDQDASNDDNPMLACVGHDPAHRDIFVVKLTNNRGHGLLLRVPTDWTWIHLTGLAGLEDKFIAATSRLMAASVSGEFITLAPGQQVHFGFSREDIGDESPFTIQGDIDPLAVAYGLIFSVTEEVLGTYAESAILSTALLGKCLGNLGWKGWTGGLDDLVEVLWDHLACLANPKAVSAIIETIMGTPFNSISDALKDSGKVAKFAKSFARKMLIFGAAQQVLELTFSLLANDEVFALSAWVRPGRGNIGEITATPTDTRPTTSTSVDLSVRDLYGDPLAGVGVSSSTNGAIGQTNQSGHLVVTQATQTTVIYWANATPSPAYEPALGDVRTTLALSPPPQCFLGGGGDSGTYTVDLGQPMTLVRPDTGGPWDYPQLAEYQGRLEWGDGAVTATQWGGGPYSHIYGAPGTYTLKRIGDGVLSSSLERCVDDGFYTIHVRPTTRQMTAYNLVTNGASQMREDVPAYLSTVTRNFCKRDGCAIGGTDMNTGRALTAYCTVIGDRTTNGQDNSAIDDGNPGLYTSTRWYGIQWDGATRGYLSEAWVHPADRGGAGLPPC